MELKIADARWADEVWENIQKKMAASVGRLDGKIPYSAGQDGRYDNRGGQDINWWTNGFMGGLLWLMYRFTKDERYRAAAQRQEEMLDKAMENYEKLDHDVGFLWLLTSAAAYRITNAPGSRRRALAAADVLAARLNLRGGYIRAWNGEGREGWAIIDCMMNLPLLYWASEQTGDDRFAQVARRCADTTMRNHLREDGSVRHIVIYDSQTGMVQAEDGGQGYDVGSSWSRGQAWAIYGFALSYRYTGQEAYLNAAKRVANYFLACTGTDGLPRCDFRAPEQPVVYDSTAGAIAACGLLELADHVQPLEKGLYTNAAVFLLRAMEQAHCCWDTSVDFITKNGTERYHDCVWHIPIIYGDYYFTEAICRLRGMNAPLWE